MARPLAFPLSINEDFKTDFKIGRIDRLINAHPPVLPIHV